MSRIRVARFAAAMCSCSLLLTAAVTRAQEPAHEAGHGEAGTQTVGVFIGDTTENRRDGFTFGLEYEYRFSPDFGVGITAEHAAGDVDTSVFVVPLAVHRGPWKLYVGPGLERGEEETEPLFRVGAEYGFHVGDYEISPQVDLDFVSGERLFVVGVVFAREL